MYVKSTKYVNENAAYVRKVRRHANAASSVFSQQLRNGKSLLQMKIKFSGLLERVQCLDPLTYMVLYVFGVALLDKMSAFLEETGRNKNFGFSIGQN